jgi:hypothetical protein
MNAAERDAWNSRPMTVKVFERCDRCETLREDVKEREHTAYYPFSFAIKAKCCAPCFDVAKKKAADEAREASAACC